MTVPLPTVYYYVQFQSLLKIYLYFHLFISKPIIIYTFLQRFFLFTL